MVVNTKDQTHFQGRISHDSESPEVTFCYPVWKNGRSNILQKSFQPAISPKQIRYLRK